MKRSFQRIRDGLPGIPFIQLRQRWGKQPADFRDMKFPKALEFCVTDEDAQIYISAFESRGIQVAKTKVQHKGNKDIRTLQIWIPDKETEARITKIRMTLIRWINRKFMRQFMNTHDWFRGTQPC